MKLTPLDPPDFDVEVAMEVLRVWLDKDSQTINHRIALLHEISNDPGAWGILLVDIARHVANAYASESESENQESIYSEVLSRIKVGFDEDWEQSP